MPSNLTGNTLPLGTTPPLCRSKKFIRNETAFYHFLCISLTTNHEFNSVIRRLCKMFGGQITLGFQNQIFIGWRYGGNDSGWQKKFVCSIKYPVTDALHEYLFISLHFKPLNLALSTMVVISHISPCRKVTICFPNVVEIQANTLLFYGLIGRAAPRPA